MTDTEHRRSSEGIGPAVAVDLTGWFAGDPTAMDAIAAEVDAACQGSGFLAITGHGIPEPLMREMLDVTQAFFDRPAPEKLGYRPDDPAMNRGYAPLGSEALSYSLGVASPPDLFEAFNIGREAPPEGERPDDIARYFSANIWPDDPAAMRAVWLRYWDACEELGLVLTDIFARALGLADGWFRPMLDRSPSVMRAINYERRGGEPPAAPDQLRMGAHSDYGSLTILLADPVPGLQIRSVDGEWHDVVPPEGGFMVNLGDLLAEWTNDRWRSTVHRVVPPPAGTTGAFRRRSVAWFQQPNHDARIEVLDVCVDDANPPLYPPTTSGAHLMAKLMGPRAGAPVDVDERFLA